MAKLGRGVFFLTTIAGMLAVAGYVFLVPVSVPEGGRWSTRSRDPIPVIVSGAIVTDVPVYLEGLGTVRALNTVTVQPLVDGRLVSVDFKEGQNVRRGEILARIDPTLYQAAFDQARARRAQNEAQLANARLDLDRKLNSKLASSQQQIDTAKALVAQLEAVVKGDQANVANAEAQLGYTRIVAPIDGRTGIRLVDEGNVVRASSSSAIVVITQVQPISVLFNLPQQHLGRINASLSEGRLKVDVLGAEARDVIDTGVLQVVDNQVDQATGTVRLRAEFPNADLQLWPGQFVNVRLLIEMERQVVVVPTAAVQQGPSGPFVFVLGEARDTVSVRQIKTGQRDDEKTVVASGLNVSERVVVTGFSRLRDGSKVSISDRDSSVPAQPPIRQRHKRGSESGKSGPTSRESSEGPTP